MSNLPPVDDYPRKQATDIETAMARAIARRLEEASFPLLAPPGKLLKVFDEWADYMDGNVAPSACVMPDGDLVFAPGQGTPTLLEDTWWPKGQPGWGLYKLSEATREFKVVARAATGAERNAVKAGVDVLFFDPKMIGRPGGDRFGVLVQLDDYFCLPARLTLTASRKLDGADNAAKNIQEAEFTIRCEAAQVKVAPVQPFTLKTNVQDVTQIPAPPWARPKA